MENIRIGDLVCLKSNKEFAMTVVEFVMEGNEKAILCKWLDVNGALYRDLFPVQALELFLDK